MISPSEANQVEACGYSAVVKRNSVPTTSPYAAFGGAFAALVDPGCPEAELAARMAMLDGEQTLLVKALAAIYCADTPIGKGAVSEWKFALLSSGELTDWEDPKRVTRGKIDHKWLEPKVLVVRDDKTGFLPVNHPADNLQLGVYAKAASACDDVPWGVPVRAEIANPTKMPRLVSYVYQPGEVEVLWQRFLRADAKASVEKPLAEPGPACSACYQRQQCPARLLPAMYGEPGDLAVFTKGDPGLTSNEIAAKALLVIDALEDVVDRAKEQLKAYTVTNGPIRAGDRLWKGWETAGRRTGPSLEELEKRGMGDLIRIGKPGTRFEWRSAKKEK